MPTPTTPIMIPKASQDGLLQFHRNCYEMQALQWNLREQMRAVDLAYIRELDLTKDNVAAKAFNSVGDADKLQNLTIPVVMPQVESAVVYQSSVFLTGIPLFGVNADPEFEDQAKQMETVIEENSIRGGWTRHITMALRDSFKYNLGAIEVSWDQQVTAALETNMDFAAGKIAQPKEIIWEGNCLKRLDLYNTFFDTRVAPAEMHLYGEFIGYTELMGRTKLKTKINQLPNKMIDNVKQAFESGLGSGAALGGIQSYYTPYINPNALLNRDIFATTNWMSWAGMTTGLRPNIEYRNMYEVTTMYARIIPSDFNLKVPAANTPQVWKFIIVNHSVIIYAERQTNAHNYLPVLMFQPLEDGLTYQTKSLANNVKPMQDVSSALMNSVIASRRRAISDRGLYDPSRVNAAQINSANPSAKIPVRPAAYGKPLNEAYYPIPFRDDQSPIMMQQIQQINALANVISGQNPVKQGQFVKGNKTQHEFDDVMSHANGRDQITSMLLETQLFTPMKEILKTNILQYQGGTSLYSPSKKEQVNIDPVKLRTAVMAFKVSDGLTPTDKLINSDVTMVAMQQIGASPQIGAGYNIAPLFSYLMKTQGADITEFEKSAQQQAYEQAVQQWQQLILQMQKANPAITAQQYPPQPQPATFGYNPQQQLNTPQNQQQAQVQQTPMSGVTSGNPSALPTQTKAS